MKVKLGYFVYKDQVAQMTPKIWIKLQLSCTKTGPN